MCDKEFGKESADGILGEVKEDIERKFPMVVENTEISTTERTVQELNKKIAEAEEVGSFYITITTKKDENLQHWQGRINFPKDDCAHSLRELLKDAPKPYEVAGNVRRFKPRE